MCTLRASLQWAASIDIADSELFDKVMASQISREEHKRGTMLDLKEAKTILNYLGKYHFASRDHVLTAVGDWCESV